MKPTKRIIEIANANPTATRQQVLAMCVAEGIHRPTASTYYAKWRREHHKKGGKQARMATCPTCGTHFRSDSSFDAHRIDDDEYAGHPHYGRRCLTQDEMVARGMEPNTIGVWGFPMPKIERGS